MLFALPLAAEGKVGKPASYSKECKDAYKGLRHYRKHHDDLARKLGRELPPPLEQNASCQRLRERAAHWREAVKALEDLYVYHYAWPKWLPVKWQRIGACETGHGRRPGNWKHWTTSYEGAFGFAHGSWDDFVPKADPKAGPYPSSASEATPRQQYEVALAIYRAYGLSGWGCRGA